MIHKLFFSLIFTFLYSCLTPPSLLYAQPIIANDQPAKVFKKEQQPPPLGPACGGGGTPGALQIDPDRPTCCVSGYVYIDGKPTKDAIVTVSSPNQKTSQVTTPVEEFTFNIPINISSLDVEPRSTITFTARAYTVTTLSGNSHRVDEPSLVDTGRATTEVSVPRFSRFINLSAFLDSGNLELGIDEPVTITTNYVIQTVDGQEYIDDVTITQEIPAPSYHLGLHQSPLDVKPGDRVTIAASYNGITQIDYFIAKSGTIQVDVILPNTEQSNSDTKPIATISYINPKVLYQHETLYIEGRAADPDGSNIIQTHLWKSDGMTITTQAAFTMTAGGLPIGTQTQTASGLPIGIQTLQYQVQDDEGEWSEILTEQILIRESERIYLPTIMQ